MNIEIHNWNNWDSSYWVKLVSGKNEVIVDSGVILDLSTEIEKLYGIEPKPVDNK